MSPLKNVAASVHHRLKNASKDSGGTFNDLAQYYALERWLYRMSKSRYADLFILKGALMLVAWRAPILRATCDIDLLARMNNDPASILEGRGGSEEPDAIIPPSVLYISDGSS